MEKKSSSPAISMVGAILRAVLVLALLYLFLVAIEVLGSSFKSLGADTAEKLITSFTNPFAGLAGGILATVLVQSSSVTTSTIVGLVGQNALPLSVAVPMIMGANNGTTVTNTIVSLGHITRNNEFKRAFAGATVHDGGTYVCMEGPAFSTRAESNLYRSWGARVIGMTNLPEAKLAREAEISYATVAMSTDYDCWHEGHDDVTVEQVVAVARANVAVSKGIIRAAIPMIAAHDGPAPMSNALAGAIMTAPEAIPPEQRDLLDPLVCKYLE